LIYLDSCVVIYAVEDDSARGTAVRRRLADADDEVPAISPLVMLECLVRPLRDNDLALADHYRRAFAQFTVLDAGVPEHLRAAELRARQGLRTPDAIHLAVAQLNGCRELWTNDARMSTAAHGLAVDVTRA
jgi:predicted nucleic acid-binding protein